MNVLILSAGTRNKVVRYFKKELEGRGRVVATDCSSLAPALYEADRAYLVPRIDAPDYIDRILEICEKEEITGCFSLIDPELSLLAKNRERFLEKGCTPVVSSYELCETSLDKWQMYHYLQERKIPTATCYLNWEDFRKAREGGGVSYPVFMKPRRGSASIRINRVNNDEEARILFQYDEEIMAQEFMSGQEYGADCYVDLISGKCVSVFLKKKIKMRAGETDKSVSINKKEVLSMVASFAEEAGYRGMIDLDLFEEGGVFYLSEVNPRFGGGYPHAYECGVNFPGLLLRNLEGKENACEIGNYPPGITMMKYNEVKILPQEELIG